MLSVKLETFEGPLDLLLHLIDRNKVSIYDIPIIEITAQYMEYVNAMDKKDLDLVSDFLVMAATLLDIKSRFRQKWMKKGKKWIPVRNWSQD